MNHNNFSSLDLLVDFVNDNAIIQSKIVTIKVLDGRWYLVWYT